MRRRSDVTIAFVDTETDGFSPTENRILEIAVEVWKGGDRIEQWSSLVRGGNPTPETSRRSSVCGAR